MKVIEKINNNAAICIDSSGNKLVAIGSGIGFPKVPYELDDMSKIQMTYYDIDANYINLINQVPESIFTVSNEIVNILRNRKDFDVSSNVVFTLADHINFAIERYKQNVRFENPLYFDVKHLYFTEYEIGLKGLQIIKDKIGVNLPTAEATNIALHLINAQSLSLSTDKPTNFYEILEGITDIIGRDFDIFIDKESVNYSRFVSHIRYLLKEKEGEKIGQLYDKDMFENLVDHYPKTHKCVLQIDRYLENERDINLDNEEILYLMLHVNRLTLRNS